MKRSADGEIKTCRIHDSLHEFCKTEASKDNLFYIIDGEQGLESDIIQSRRRVCVHPSSSSTAKIFDVKDDPSCRFLSCCCNKMKKSPYPSGEHVHSLLLSSSDFDLKQEELIAIPNAFPLLRVLNIESFKLRFQLPNELFSLNLLKYLAITTDLNLLPKAFKNLRELQTLVIKTTEGTVLEINGGIWNMEKLRHVQTNAFMQLPSPPQNNTGKTNIRTLSSISPACCTKMIFSKTPYLKKLGVRGNLEELLKGDNEEICLFNNLQMLKCLENLKLYGQGANALKVPMLEKFADRLRKLTFCRTSFKWDDMEKLGSLEQLEVLKLDENAFISDEESWNLKSNLVFNQLQYLRIGRTNLKTWTIAENNFPVLENLVLRNCTNLEAIPPAFAEVDNLKVIELYHMTENAINSARQVLTLDLKITPLPPPKATAHEEQTHSKENVNTGRLDIPSSSISQSSQTAHEEQTHGKENVNTGRLDLPSSSISQLPQTAHEEQTNGKKNGNTGRLDLPSSSISQSSQTAHEEQTNGKKNGNTDRLDLPSSSISQSSQTVTILSFVIFHFYFYGSFFF
nr:putative late blight resistance protein homolog R1B-8 [Ipomoea batatas]